MCKGPGAGGHVLERRKADVVRANKARVEFQLGREAQIG